MAVGVYGNAMSLRTEFLGWDGPIVDKVCDYLLKDMDLSKPVDLEGILIVVPTRQAGRHLREALALRCDEQNTTVLSAWTVTPAFFLLNSNNGSVGEASPTAEKAIWADLLLKIDLGEYTDLFPAAIQERDYRWALHTGDMIARLRRTLTDGGLRISDVPDTAKDELEESDRWADMGRLEEAYLAELARRGHLDPILEEIERAKDPKLPDGVERIIVAAVPAPTPLMLEALKVIEGRGIPLDVLVHAPEQIADWFDDWGQPRPEKWCTTTIDIPRFEEHVRLAADPESQARLVHEVIAEHSCDIGPNDIAIGVPDRSVLPFIESHLAEYNLQAFDPAEKAASDHPLYRLLEAFCDLYATSSYDAFSRLLRHPEVLHYFGVEQQVSTRNLLKELDAFQSLHLPMDFNDINARFSGPDYCGPGRPEKFGSLGKAVHTACGWLHDLGDGFEDGIRSLLKTVYGARKLIGDSPREKELEAVATAVGHVLRECAEAATELDLEIRDAIALFLQRLTDETWTPERDGAFIDLEGWLELPWNNSALLIVTGMNEGSVPDSRLGDVFIPDRLRRALNLPNDETRFARDVYLLTAMIKSRPEPGRVIILVGKHSAVGDPLKPSRLLFRCEDDELLLRAGHLLGELEETQRNFAFNRSFLLDPSAPLESSPEKLVIDHLSATRFGAYLECPFRFYLKNVLRMEAVDDEVAGLDAPSFGNMIHFVLEVLADENLRSCSDQSTIAAALHDRLAKWIFDRFGKEPPLTVRLAADSAAKRLSHAAGVQAAEARSGWEILDRSEERLEITINGFRVSGRIDRIDRHAQTGALRVVDYKSSSVGIDPKKSHLSSPRKKYLPLATFKIREGAKEKEYAWTDLQLPLYSMMVQEMFNTPEPVQAAYFNLPKAVTQTELVEWPEMTGDVVGEARACAARIIDAIKAKQFWPPADKVRFEDFENITIGSLAETVDEAKFKAFLGII